MTTTSTPQTSRPHISSGRTGADSDHLDAQSTLDARVVAAEQLSTRATSQVGRLYLEFISEPYTVEPTASMTFGRAGDIVIDENPFLHRIVGRFAVRNSTWWIENRGSTIEIQICDATGNSRTVVAPGIAQPLSFGQFMVQFSAGPTNYELNGELESFEWMDDLFDINDGSSGQSAPQTLEWGRIQLNHDQRLLLVALAERELIDPHRSPHPVLTSREGAHRLGWSMPKFNRKLDHLCEKLHRHGVRGVHGVLGASADDRRRVLIDHAISTRLVTVEDVKLLPN